MKSQFIKIKTGTYHPQRSFDQDGNLLIQYLKGSEKMSFDETKAKRKKFVELFKKYRDLVIVESLTYNEDDDGDGNASASWIRHVLSNQNAPAVMWDTAEDDDQRGILFLALQRALTEKQTQLQDEISSLDTLKAELSQIPDEEDDEEDGDDIPVSNDTDDSVAVSSNDESDTILYHASLKENEESILENGLLTMNRQHVYFWEDFDEAVNVARRFNENADVSIFEVSRQELEEAGFEVRQKDFGYGPQWCVKGNVPAQYIALL